MPTNPIRLALLISGGGTTAEAIINACAEGQLPGVKPVLVIASRPDAKGISKEIFAGMDSHDVIVLERKKFETGDAFGQAIIDACQRREVNLIGQYGWLPLTPANVIAAYPNRVINQHPGPLEHNRPDFGGKGMYGRAVHCARLLFVRMTQRNFWTEVVAHRVTAELDQGGVIRGRRVEILPDDDVYSLQQRALPVEHQVQIEALGMIATGNDQPRNYNEHLVRYSEMDALETAKRMARLLFPKG